MKKKHYFFLDSMASKSCKWQAKITRPLLCLVALLPFFGSFSAFAQGEPVISFKTTLKPGTTLDGLVLAVAGEELTYEGVSVQSNPYFSSLTVTDPNGEIKIKGRVKQIGLNGNEITEMTFSNNEDLLTVMLNNNKISSLDVSQCPNLEKLYVEDNLINGASMTNLANSLPNRSATGTTGKFSVYDPYSNANDQNEVTREHAQIAINRGWKVYQCSSDPSHFGEESLMFPDVVATPDEGGEGGGEKEEPAEAEIFFKTNIGVGKTLFAQLIVEEGSQAVVEGGDANFMGSLCPIQVTDPDGNIRIKGAVKQIALPESQISELSFSNSDALEKITFTKNQIKTLDFNQCPNIQSIYIESNQIDETEMGKLVNSLPDRSGKETRGKLVVFNSFPMDKDQNVITQNQVNQCTQKGWDVYQCNYQTGEEKPYPGIDAEAKTYKITIVSPSEGGRIYLQGYDNSVSEHMIADGTEVFVGIGAQQGYELNTLTINGVDIKESLKFVVTEDAVLEGSFKKSSYAVTLVNDSPYGTIAIEGYDADKLKSVEHGTTLKVIATPLTSSYVLSELLVNDRNILPEMTFTVSKETTVSAKFTFDESKAIILKTSRASGETITLKGVATSDVVIMGAEGTWVNNQEVTLTLKDGVVFLGGDFTSLECGGNDLTSLNLSSAFMLETLRCEKNSLTELVLPPIGNINILDCSDNRLKSLDLSKQLALDRFICFRNEMQGDDLTATINNLPSPVGPEKAFVPVNLAAEGETNHCTVEQVNLAKEKGWNVFDFNNAWADKKPYDGEATAIEDILAEGGSVIYDAEAAIIRILDIQPDQAIILLDVNGNRMAEGRTDAQGNATISTQGAPEGTYLLQVGESVMKISVR